jgi:hypothetical protein
MPLKGAEFPEVADLAERESSLLLDFEDRRKRLGRGLDGRDSDSWTDFFRRVNERLIHDGDNRSVDEGALVDMMRSDMEKSGRGESRWCLGRLSPTEGWSR